VHLSQSLTKAPARDPTAVPQARNVSSTRCTASTREAGLPLIVPGAALERTLHVIPHSSTDRKPLKASVLDSFSGRCSRRGASASFSLVNPPTHRSILPLSSAHPPRCLYICISKQCTPTSLLAERQVGLMLVLDPRWGVQPWLALSLAPPSLSPGGDEGTHHASRHAPPSGGPSLTGRRDNSTCKGAHSISNPSCACPYPHPCPGLA
jgi:hypothetical protein